MPTGPKKRTTTTRRIAATRTATEAVAPEFPSAPSHDAIASRAYQMFLQRGGAHGRDFDDWLAAERELQQ
jgi:hypothetical protein